MKSFIKNHKRSSSSPANTPDMGQQNQSEFYMSALPLSSSNLQGAEFTPPQVRSNKGISSPKKLFSPIKNLFSSPGQPKADSGVFKAGDQLKNALNATDRDKNNVNDRTNSSPRQRTQSCRGNNAYDGAFYGTNGRQESAERQIKSKYADQQSDGYRTDAVIQNGNKKINYTTMGGFGSSEGQEENGVLKAFDISIPEDSEYRATTSQINRPHGNSYVSPRSLSETDAHKFGIINQNNDVTQAKLESDRSINKSNAINEESESLEDSDGSSSLSENSSNFSFMQGKRGGRNTSVKYYKTAPSKRPDANNVNTFNEEDLGDIDDYSDYDYENNGLVDDLDDISDNIREEEADVNGQYLKIFDPEEDHENTSFKGYGGGLNVNRSYSPSDDKESVLSSGSGSLLKTGIPNVYVASSLSNQRVFNHSYHSSIDGFSIKDDRESHTSSKQESSGDFLENYFDSEYSSKGQNSRRTSQLLSTNNSQLGEINSPLINGLTVGHNLGHRALRPKPKSNSSNDLGKLASKILIHRHNISGSIDDYGKDNLEHRSMFNADKLLKMRDIQSFHTSISEEINLKIPEKIDSYEKFQKKREESNSHSVHDNKRDVNFPYENPHSKYGDNIVFRFPIASDAHEMYSYKEGKTSASLDQSSDQRTEHTAFDNYPSLKAQQSDNSPLNSEEEVSKRNIRNSISQMMNTLAIFETGDKPNTSKMGKLDSSDTLYTNFGKEPESSSNRKSISDMMSTLKHLDQIPGGSAGQSMTRNNKSRLQKVENKLLNDENIKSKNLPFWEATEKGYPIADKLVSDENQSQEDFYSNELIDEINSVPEDFDFEAQKNNAKQYFKLESPFRRTNSYNKIPKKVINESNYNNNRIETPTKTVTIYRNKSKKSNDNKGCNLNMGLYTGPTKSLPKPGSEISSSNHDDFLKTMHEKEEIESVTVLQDSSSKKSTESIRNPYSLNTIDEFEFDGLN